MKRKYFFVLALLVVHLFVLSKLQFTAWPEMVSFPYLINHGFITYKDMVHAYPPLLVNVLAVIFKMFGYKLVILKVFGWMIILAGDLLLFLLIQKLTREKYQAQIGLFIYVILQPILEGNMVWPDLFIIPFLLLTLLFLLNKKYLFAGVFIALAILTKQTGILFLGIIGIWFFFYERKKKIFFDFGLGILVVILPFLLSIIKQNVFYDFVNWTIIYPSEYWTKFPGYVQLSPTIREYLILLVLFTPLAYLTFRANKKIFTDKTFLLLFGFLICGIVGVYPRFSFFHFQPALAFLIIIMIFMIKKFSYWLLLIPLLILGLNFRSLQFGESRFWTNLDIELGQIIQKESPEGKPIYLLGLDSSLYTFSSRLPNKPWLDNFGWYLEIPGVQEKLVVAFTENPPSTIFWATPQSGNWYDIGVYQPKMITNYIINNYTKTKEIEKGVWGWTKR